MVAKPVVKRILVATDFLESSRLALDYAVAFALHFKATVVVLHALELQTPAQDAEIFTSRPSVTRLAAVERIEAIAVTCPQKSLPV
jgi:nucleotide-binding universal stress UspA family protein